MSLKSFVGWAVPMRNSNVQTFMYNYRADYLSGKFDIHQGDGGDGQGQSDPTGTIEFFAPD